MNVYLSARYPRRAELRAYADELVSHDIDVSSRWCTGQPDEGGTEAVPTAAHAQADLDDLYASTVLVTFAELPNSAKECASRGGRHVEFGIAYETGIVCIVVAPEPLTNTTYKYKAMNDASRVAHEVLTGTRAPAPISYDYQGENVFHLLPGVIRVGSWPEAKALLIAMRERELDEGWADRIATLWDETEADAAALAEINGSPTDEDGA